MKHIGNIIKKELDKIFKSPRLIFSTFLLPGLLIFVMYSLMGNSAQNQTTVNNNHEYQIMMMAPSEKMETVLNNLYYDKDHKYKVKINYYESSDNLATMLEQLGNVDSTLINKIKESIKSEETDIWIINDEVFDQVLEQKASNTNVTIFSHSSNNYSSIISNSLNQALQQYEVTINPTNIYNINTSVSDLASEKEVGSSILGMLAPMLIMTFIFAGALSIGSDSIAGEKERGTIATMLMAPISKNEIVLGKIFSAIILTILASICSFVGLMFALRQFSAAMGTTEGMLTLSLTFASSVEILVMILLISLIAVSLFLVASTFAKSTKEATMYAMPVYILGIISGVFTMYSSNLPSSLISYLIPIYNLTLGLKGIFINSLSLTQFFLIVGSNIIYFFILIFIVKKMFNNERIMFAR